MTASSLAAALPVLAQDDAAGAGIANIVFLVLLIAVFWFFLIRPQRNQAKRHRALVESLKTGDEVVTAGGLHGRIRSVDDETISLEIAPSTTVTVSRGRIVSKATEDEPETGGGATG